MTDHIDPGAEAAVVGAALVDPTVLDEVHLEPAHFQSVGHGLIWQALQTLHAEGAPTDPVAVVSALVDEGTIGQAGGAEHVAELARESGPVQSASWHAARVVEMARRRAAAALASRAAQVTAMNIDADQMLEQIRGRLEAIDGTDTEEGPAHWSAVIERGMEAIENAATGADERGIPTGLADLDHALGGLKPGDVTIVAGRPGSGKSVLAAQSAAHVALDLELPALMVSLEMREPELYNRIVASRIGINLGNLNTGTLDDAAWSKLAKQAGMSADSPLWIDDTPNHTLASISSLARRWKRRHGLRLLVIDYLQLITVGRAENRQVAVSELSRGIKLLASQLEIPILMAAQLNRNSESRGGKVPSSADLRESGSLENDASVIVLVHREAASDPNSLRQGEADLIVAKNRNGAQATVPVAAQLHYARFASLAKQDQIGGY